MTDSRKPRVETTSRQTGVSGAVLLLLGATLAGVLTVGNAFVLDLVIGEFRLAWLAGMLGLEIASIVGAAVLWPSLRPVVRWHWLEIFGMLVVGGVFLAHAIHLAPTDWMPTSFSVDCSHQHLLVDYIYTHRGFPDGVDYLYIYNDYPVGPSALAALLARLLDVLPGQTMYPLAALFVTVQVMLAYGTSVELLPRRSFSYILAALATWAVFLVYSYTVRVFAERFYSNMMMGDLVVLCALWVIVVKDRLSPALIAGVTACLVFGCLNSYPAWLPFVVTPLVTALLLDRSSSTRERWILASVVATVAAILAFIALVDQWSFITWFAPSRGRRLTPGWQSLGGLFLVLVGWGVWTLVQNWRRHPGLVVFLLIDATLVAALYVAALLDKLTLYIPDKTFYFNAFLFTVLAALGLHRIWEKVAPAKWGREWAACVAVIALGLGVVVGGNARFPRQATFPITLDEYRVAYQVARDMPDVELAYLVRNEMTFYWTYGCILKHTHDLEARREQWRLDTPTYEGWIQDVTAPRRALVSDLVALPRADGRWRVVIRSGNSGVIEKVAF